jgi:hypothetical protein
MFCGNGLRRHHANFYMKAALGQAKVMFRFAQLIISPWPTFLPFQTQSASYQLLNFRTRSRHDVGLALEVAVENRLAVVDQVRKTARGDGLPALGFSQFAGRSQDEFIALRALTFVNPAGRSCRLFKRRISTLPFCRGSMSSTPFLPTTSSTVRWRAKMG